MPQVFESEPVSLSTLLVLETYLEERNFSKEGMISRLAKDFLRDWEELGVVEEDLVVGIALTKAIANWRAMLMFGEFDAELHQAQMHYEMQKVAEYLVRQYRTKPFLFFERSYRTKSEYYERLAPHSRVYG